MRIECKFHKNGSEVVDQITNEITKMLCKFDNMATNVRLHQEVEEVYKYGSSPVKSYMA